MEEISPSLVQQLQQMQAKHPDALLTLKNQAGRFAYVSPKWESVIGYKPIEVVGQPISMLVVPADLEHIALTLQDAVLNGESVEVGITLRAKTGEDVPVRGFIWRIMDADTEEIFLMGCAWPVQRPDLPAF